MHVESNSTKQRSSACLQKWGGGSRQPYQIVRTVPCGTETECNGSNRETKCSNKTPLSPRLSQIEYPGI